MIEGGGWVMMVYNISIMTIWEAINCVSSIAIAVWSTCIYYSSNKPIDHYHSS